MWEVLGRAKFKQRHPWVWQAQLWYPVVQQRCWALSRRPVLCNSEWVEDHVSDGGLLFKITAVGGDGFGQ